MIRKLYLTFYSSFGQWGNYGLRPLYSNKPVPSSGTYVGWNADDDEDNDICSENLTLVWVGG